MTDGHPENERLKMKAPSFGDISLGAFTLDVVDTTE